MLREKGEVGFGERLSSIVGGCPEIIFGCETAGGQAVWRLLARLEGFAVTNEPLYSTIRAKKQEGNWPRVDSEVTSG